MLSRLRPVRRFRPGPFLALALSSVGALHSQTEVTFLEQKQRLAILHVSEVFESWMSANDVPGAVVALVEGDHTLALAGFGAADVELGVPVDPASTVFSVGELVRPLMATAVLQLVEQGRIHLDQDISETLGRELLPVDGHGPLTAEQLLLHTAGFDHRMTASRARAPAEVVPLETYLRRRLPPRVRPPGMISIPSSHGSALVGLLIERASGDDLAAFLQESLFRPLGMSRSAVAAIPPVTDAMATGYRRTSDGLEALSADYPQALAASLLWTTGSDMARWLEAVVDGGALEGRTFLSAQSIEAMLTRRFGNHPSLPGRTLAFRQGRQYSPAELYLAASGNGFSSVMMILPQRRVGLFAAFNREVDFWTPVYRVLDHYGARRDTLSNRQPSVTIDEWGRYTGYWRDASTSQATAEKLLSLIRQDRLSRGENGTLRWRSQSFVPLGPTDFRQVDGEGRLCFVGNHGRFRFAASDGQVLERLTWFESRPVQVTLWAFFATLFLATGWPRLSLPPRRDSLTHAQASWPRWPEFVARLAATLHFLFIVSLTLLVAINLRSATPELLYAVPLVVTFVLALPLVAGILTLAAVSGLGSVWRAPYWSLRRRLLLTALTLALVAFLPFLWSWNLLGFHL